MAGALPAGRAANATVNQRGLSTDALSELMHVLAQREVARIGGNSSPYLALMGDCGIVEGVSYWVCTRLTMVVNTHARHATAYVQQTSIRSGSL